MPGSTRVYLDCHATTPCDPRVVEAMAPYWSEEFGNSASKTHAFGWRAQEAVEHARRRLASAIGADAREIVFTSGATESNNLALLGLARAQGRGRVVSCVTEHRAVLDPIEVLKKEGFETRLVGVDAEGRIDLDALASELSSNTVCVSVMLANNEIGTVQPLAEIARLTRERGIPLHSDAAQALGKLPIDVDDLGVDSMSITAHKLYGPKGVGALYVRRRTPRIRIEPLIHGGGHERGLRSGTLATPLVVGFSVAAELATAELAVEEKRISTLRDRLFDGLTRELDGVERNGPAEDTLAGNLNLSFRGVEAEALLMGLPELALSTGSACTSATPEPSHVLRALGLGVERSLSAIRVGLGRYTTDTEVDFALGRIVSEVRRLRGLSPVADGPRKR